MTQIAYLVVLFVIFICLMKKTNTKKIIRTEKKINKSKNYEYIKPDYEKIYDHIFLSPNKNYNSQIHSNTKGLNKISESCVATMMNNTGCIKCATKMCTLNMPIQDKGKFSA